MPTKIRLQRGGKKGKPFYQIVIADGRAPRDGKFIEKLGTYNPVTAPATIELDFERAVQWLQNGAQPTDTVRAILSFKGVMMKNHLLNGVKKGALTEDQANVKFEAWMQEKASKISNSVKEKNEKERADKKARLDAETKVNEERANALNAKRLAEIEAEAKANAPAVEEAPAAEETKEESAE